MPSLVRSWRVLSSIPGVTGLGKLAGRIQANRTGNARWRHAADWGRTIGSAWWLRKSVYAPEELFALMGHELAEEALLDFGITEWVEAMSGVHPFDGKLALGQIESTTYLRNQLLRDSDWASMDHSVELRTPLVDAYLLESLQTVLPSLRYHKNKRLLAMAPEKPLPRDIIERRKTGFEIPVNHWLAAASTENKSRPGSRDWAQKLVGFYEDGCR